MPTRKRKFLTSAIVHEAVKQLKEERPYAEIARNLKISAATLGRIKSAMEGKTSKSNANIVKLLEDAPKHAPQSKDTHGLRALLTALESDLAKIQQKIQLVREKL